MVRSLENQITLNEATTLLKGKKRPTELCARFNIIRDALIITLCQVPYVSISIVRYL